MGHRQRAWQGMSSAVCLTARRSQHLGTSTDMEEMPSSCVPPSRPHPHQPSLTTLPAYHVFQLWTVQAWSALSCWDTVTYIGTHIGTHLLQQPSPCLPVSAAGLAPRTPHPTIRTPSP